MHKLAITIVLAYALFLNYYFYLRIHYLISQDLSFIENNKPIYDIL